MLACITCTKQIRAEDKDVSTPSAKLTIKSLGSQIKDIAIKATWAIKSQNQKHVDDSDNIVPTSEQFHFSYKRSEYVEGHDSNEWVAQVEPGVLITLITLPEGGNDLKRIRFSRDIFDKEQAQRWWWENYEKLIQLYNVEKFNHQAVPLQPAARSEEERSKIGYTDASTASSSSREVEHSGEVSMTNSSDLDNEWVQQDEPGVYVTVRALPDGTRQLKRVRFRSEKFGEAEAREWWEKNIERIKEQYFVARNL